MGIGQVTSTTRVGNEYLESSTVNTHLYMHNQQSNHKEPAETPSMKYQKPQKAAKQPKPNPVVPKRGTMKDAAEAVKEANEADLRKKNIK